MWDLIASVPDHCLSFYLTIHCAIIKDGKIKKYIF